MLSTFFLTKKIGGRLARVTIGKVGDINLGDAREKARRTLAEITLTGRSPNAGKRACQDRGVTLATAFGDYVYGLGIKPVTLDGYRRMMRLHLDGWAPRPLVEITRPDVRALHARIAKRSPSSANLAMRLLRAIAVFNRASGEYIDDEGRPIVVGNPVRELSRKRAWKKVEPRRARIATRDLGAWLAACDAARGPSPTPADYVEFVLLARLRRREAEPLRWQDVDLDEGTVRIPGTRSGRLLEIPLPDRALDPLRRRRALWAGPFVFPGDGKTGHIVEPKSVCCRAVRRVHDAR